MWGRTDLRNTTVGQGIPSELAGIPYGHLHPSSWNMPYQGGAMSAFTFKGITFDVASLNVAAGRNIDGSAVITFTVGPSQLDLIVSAVGSSSVTFTASGTLLVALNAEGSATLNFTVGPSTLGAEAGLFGSSTVTVTLTGTMLGQGNLAGNITPFTELSPQNLAAAVWSALAADYNVTDTMGNKLNLASSGGVDYAALAAAVLAAAQTNPIHADTKRMNGATVNGTGIPSDLWRGTP